MIRALFLALLVGCAQSGGYDITGNDTDVAPADDTVVDTPTDTPVDDTVDPGTSDDAALLGHWRSEGEDVAELLAGPPSFFVRVDTTFRADATYTVEGEDRDGTPYTFEGTWEADVGPVPHHITNHQTSPYVTTASGIYRVAGAVLTLDIIDTSLGTPASTDFGTSSAGDVNIQTYRKTP